MRIAVVTETFNPFRGGSARRYHEVFKRLAKKHEVHLYTPRLNRSWPRHEDIDGIQVHRSEHSEEGLITTEGLRSIRTVLRFSLWSFHRISVDGPYDVVEANHCPIFPALGSWLRSRMEHLPLSVTFHEVWYNEWYRYVPNPLYAPVGIGLEWTTTRVPDLAIAVSEVTAAGLAKYFSMSQRRIKIISNGIDPELFQRPGTVRDKDRVVFVGRLNPHKRLDLLFGAVKDLSRTHAGVKLRVVGDGPWRSIYRSMADVPSLQGRVDFVGAPDNAGVAEELKSAQVYVQSSIREGQSITALEAMAAGTPQVAVKAPGSAVPDLLAKSNSGLSVEPSAESMSGGIASLLEDGALWGRLSQNSLKYASQFTWDAIASQHEHAYLELAESKRRNRR